MVTVDNLERWFDETLKETGYKPDTRAYIIGVLLKHRSSSELDLSKKSIVLEYKLAIERSDFSTHQRIGDWALWTSTFFPTEDRSRLELTQSFGRLSYYACNRILRGQWRVYEELADELPVIAKTVRKRIIGT